ncbi:MAG: ABC transporter permease, partial [Akkermansiaceae bacterium]|nr:ABC transporter permease [Akkermansiaceae bacterium]
MKLPKNKPLPKSLWRSLFCRWVWRMAWRDSRSQRLRLVVFSLAIVSGVAALTAIHSLKMSVERGIEFEAKSLLGSDLRVSSRKQLKSDEIEGLAKWAEQVSREVNFPSMLRFLPDRGARLMQVRGMDGAYPFYGRVETQPAAAWEHLSQGGGILLEPSVLDQFSAKIGDKVELGGIRLTILGVIEKPAPRGSRFSGFAPEVYVQLGDIERSGLLGKNSMASYQMHLQIKEVRDERKLKKAIRDEFPKSRWRMET